MNRILLLMILPLLAGICASALEGDQSGTKVVRTIAYHEITSLTDDISCHNGAHPVISDSGERAAFAAYSADSIVHIYAVKTDGSELPQEVDSYKSNGDTNVVISPDGAKIASGSFGNEFRTCDIYGGSKGEFALDGGMQDYWIGNDGQVYLLVYGDTNVRGSSPSIQVKRGLWRVNFDGSGLAQVASSEEIAALLGVSADSLGLQPGYWSLDGSSSGSRFVFPVSSSRGWHIISVSTDGAGPKLREYTFPEGHVQYFGTLGISGDGLKVYYMVTPSPCCSTPTEVGLIDIESSERRVLLNDTNVPDNGRLNYDGSVLMVGSNSAWLVDTKTGGKLQLTILGGWDSSEPALVDDGLYLPSMDSSGGKFIYLMKDSKGKWQLVVAEMNPASLRQAPSIENPRFAPPYILTAEGSRANVTASISASDSLVAVGTDLLLNGLRDESRTGRVSLRDDGTKWDLSAGDGIFSGVIEGYKDLPVGPRIVRLKAEVKGSDGKRHATAVDLWPFAVAETADQADDMISSPPPAWPPVINYTTSRPPGSENPPDSHEPPQPPSNGETIRINLTGVWSCNDEGVYYIRQIGQDVWWDGEEQTQDPRWANAAYGTISGKKLTVRYADVPEGRATGYGTIELEIISNDELVAKDKPASYAGSRWTRITRTVPSDGNGSEPPVNPWDDPAVRQMIDEWIAQYDRCTKQVYPEAYVDKWGRICGGTETAMNTCTLTPDKQADWDSYHYLWVNNPCPMYYPYTVRQYVQLRQSGTFESLQGCKEKNELCYL